MERARPLLLSEPLIALGGPQGAHGLERLHQQHQQDDTDDHDVGLVTVVAVGQSDLTQAAAANDAGHGRVYADWSCAGKGR